jgi:hypothetical protein
LFSSPNDIVDKDTINSDDVNRGVDLSSRMRTIRSGFQALLRKVVDVTDRACEKVCGMQ